MDNRMYSRDISMWCHRVSLLVDYIHDHGTLIEAGGNCDNAYRRNAYWVTKIRRLVTESSILLDCVNQLCPALLIPHSRIIAGKMYTDLELYHLVSSSVGDMNPSDLTDYKIPKLGLTIWELSDRLSKGDVGVYGITLTYIKSFESSKPTHSSVIPTYPIYGTMCISDYELFHFWLREECDRRIKHKIAFPYTWFNAYRSMTMNYRKGRVNEYRTACMNYMNSIYGAAKTLSPNASYGMPPEEYIKSRDEKNREQEQLREMRRNEIIRARTITLERKQDNLLRQKQDRHQKAVARETERLHQQQLRKNNRIIARMQRLRERERELEVLRVHTQVLREAEQATRIREKREQEQREHRSKTNIQATRNNQTRADREHMIEHAMIASVIKNANKIFAATKKNKLGKVPIK